MEKMDWTVNQEGVVQREAQAKTEVMACAAHRVLVVILATKDLRAHKV